MTLAVRPLTLDEWPALEDLFGPKGACGGCWCMYWRIGSAYRKRPGGTNKADFRAIVGEGPPPGLLAFDGERAVGWCQVTPRDSVPWLDKAWRLAPVDDRDVWSISCFYIRKGCRRRGVTAALIDAAVDMARAGGAAIVEAYPLDAALTPSSSSTGYLSTFLRKGFTVAARRVPPRPIVRLALEEKGAGVTSPAEDHGGK